jgi:4-diphosphocytidyl-2-C-methyl-D-erythritol kinase
VTSPFFSLASFAKINWRLQVFGKRADGYHEIRSILQTISLHDELHFESLEEDHVAVVCDDPEVPTDEQNLVFRAAAALKDAFALRAGARVRIAKAIPTKAGLGGASSNAATTLLALTRLWKIKTSLDQLKEIAGSLGADVPFFLVGGSALATGTGTTVSPLPDDQNSPPIYLIVITPGVGVATSAAYAALGRVALTTKSMDSILSSSHNEAGIRDSHPWLVRDSLQNDFESVIFDIEPEIGRAKEALVQAGATGALLAGSGSSVFGIFAGQDGQQRALSKLKLEAGWRCFPCVTLSRNEYLRAYSALDLPFLRSFNSES